MKFTFFNFNLTFLLDHSTYLDIRHSIKTFHEINLCKFLRTCYSLILILQTFLVHWILLFMDLWARAFAQVFERQYAIANCMQRMKNQWQRSGNMKEKGKKLKFNHKYAAIIGIQQCLPITMDSELIIAEELWTGTWYVWTWLTFDL